MGAGLAVFGLALAGLFALSWWSSEEQRIKRALRQAQQVHVVAYPHGGYRRVVGTLGFVGQPLQAPISGRPCAAWQVVVEEKVESEKTTEWVTTIDETQSTPFNVTDETGTAYVDPAGSQLLISKERTSNSGFLDDPSEAEQSFLERHGQTGTGILLNKALRYREAILEEGEEVAVLGHGVRASDPEASTRPHRGGYRSPALGDRLEIRAPKSLPFYISDDRSTVR